ncbi:MAG: hypothetical protein ACFFA6_14965 [Promethearchaeota archaeon]
MTNLIKPTISILLLAVAAVCLTGLVTALLLDATKEKEPMRRTPHTTTAPAATPPIDAAAPAHTETATFAMG